MYSDVETRRNLSFYVFKREVNWKTRTISSALRSTDLKAGLSIERYEIQY